MATYVPAKRATAYRFWVSLVDQSNTKKLKSSPTLAAGDVKVVKDGGATANITTLPVVTPAASVFVQVDLSSTEMTADNVSVSFIDAAGAEWCDLFINLQTTARQVDDLAYPATSGRSLTVSAAGEADANVAKWLASAPNSLVSGRVDSSVGALAAAVIAKAAFATDVANVVPSDSGTAQAGAAGSITLRSGAVATDAYYSSQRVDLVGGTGVGQSRLISGYTGSTKVATVVPNWATNPDSTSVYVVSPFSRVDLGLWLNTAVNALVSGRVDASAGALAASVITAASIASNAITAAKIASAAIVAGTFGANALAAVWDELASAHVTALTFGALLQPVRAATAQAAAAGTITLDASASAVDAFYEEDVIHLYAGTGVGQSRFISAYVGSTKIASVVPNWATTPDNTSKFQIIQAGRVGVAEWLGAAVNALVSGRVDSSVGAVAAGAIAAASLATDLDTYQATVKLTDDNGGTTDRYTVAWYKDSAPVTSGITSPTINVFKADGTGDLVASTAMTQIASTGTYRYNEATNRIVDGVAYIAKVQATIDGATRAWEVGVSRDSS